MTDWKNHPIAVSAISTVSTAIFFITVATPIIEKHNTNQIQLLEEKSQNQLEELEEKDKEKIKTTLEHNKLIAKKDEIIKKQEQKINSLKTSVEKYKNEDRFSTDNPIPKGFRGIKLFSSYKKIGTSYPDENFDEDTYYTSIKIRDDFFSTVVYYPATCKDTKVIREIRFFYRNKRHDYLYAIEDQKDKPEYVTNKPPSEKEVEQSEAERKEALLEIFIEKFGEPTEKTKENDYIFLISESTAAIINDAGLHIVSRYTDEELNKICNGQLICPTPESN